MKRKSKWSNADRSRIRDEQLTASLFKYKYDSYKAAIGNPRVRPTTIARMLMYSINIEALRSYETKQP